MRVLAAAGAEAALVGARIQGSHTSPSNDFVDLGTIRRAPEEGEYVELTLDKAERYRFVKVFAEQGAIRVAELELFTDGRKLAGKPFGTVSDGTGGTTFAAAFDGQSDTAFEGVPTGGNYVGLDLGDGFEVAAPAFSPPAGGEASSVRVTSATPGAKIRYTVDGSNPSATKGTLYSAPIRLSDGRTNIKAIAYADCLFDSQVVSASYGDGAGAGVDPTTRGFKSYHIGNSLTDSMNAWLEPIADSTGVDHQYSRWTQLGAPVLGLWSHQNDGYGTPAGAENIQVWSRTFAPIDHVSVQPYSDPSLEPQGNAAIGMFDTVRAHSPDVQLWIYAQWPSQETWRTDSMANGADWAIPAWRVPKAPATWEEALTNQLLYHEAFRQYVDERAPGKEVLIVPAGLALLNLKREIEAGRVPGMREFFRPNFDDDLHLSKPGQYLVSLVFYVCFYRQNPEGRVTFEGTGLTEEQARIYQRIAWDTALSYPWSGLNR